MNKTYPNITDNNTVIVIDYTDKENEAKYNLKLKEDLTAKIHKIFNNGTVIV
jgi:hypothetical protein